ncbi:MAG: glycosyltransferase family 2 protein [Armatimonadetes bacterium]|nr:glycosyltransferase family 2 protein [Armatimonadota bacterium]
MRVSVIVVSFNTRDLLRRCLRSLAEVDEVIVVDNASKDGSAEMVATEFPSVKLIENDTNVGFGAANNKGLSSMTGDVALLLNSDAFATPGAVKKLAAVMEDKTVIACGGRLVNASAAEDPATLNYEEYIRGLTEGRGLIGTEESLRRRWRESRDLSTQNSCANRLTIWAVFCEQTGLEKLWPGSAFLSPYWTTRKILGRHVGEESHDVEQVMGACLMMRPKERFDERFFLYCEDTELCLRLRSHGRVLYVPDALFGHELGASSAGTRWQSVARYNRGKELYFAIHGGAPAMVVCWVLDRLGALLRFLGAGLLAVATLGLKSSFRRKASIFARVFFAPVAGPGRPDA